MKLAKQSEVGTSVAGELVSNISMSNAVMLDKAGFEGLKRALDSQASNYRNSTQADYALTGQITVANLSTEYRKATYSKDKYGKVHVTNPYCYYSSLVQGNIRIYDARTMRLVHTVAISGGSNESEELTTNNSHTCRHMSQEEIVSLVRAAGVKAASRQDVIFKNFFRPKGYVLERRGNGEKNIFKISLGKSSGVVSDQAAVLYTIQEEKHPVTGKITQQENKLGEGTVTDKIYENYAWVVIDDKKIVSQMKQGDVVKLVYEKSFMDKLFNSTYRK